jgi:hypothetical protein
MSAYNRQPSQTDRISAPSGLPQPEPYLASEEISRVPIRRLRSRSRPQRRERYWEWDSDSSIDARHRTRNAARRPSRSKERARADVGIERSLERERLQRVGAPAARQIASEMSPLVEPRPPTRQREPEPYSDHFERDFAEPLRERFQRRNHSRHLHQSDSLEDSDSNLRRHRLPRKRNPTRTPKEPPRGNQRKLSCCQVH